MKRVIPSIVVIATTLCLLTACGGPATPDRAAVQTQAVRDFAATLTAEAPTSTPTEVPTPKSTPTEVLPTSTPTPVPTATPPPAPTLPPIGTLTVDQWELVITRVLADPGKDTSRQNVVIFAMVTNHGSEGTFSPNYTIELLDSKGRRYTDDLPATFSAQDKYGVDTYAGVSMSPESTELVLFAYEAPAGEKTFTLVPGDLVGSWSGNITFTLP